MRRMEDLLAFSFPLRSRPENRWPFVIYGAFFDESDEKPSFSLAGYSAAYDTWLHLDWAWRCLLTKWKLNYFKASECENLLGEFAQYRNNPKDLKSPLTSDERTKAVEAKTAFVDAVCKHGDDLHGYGAVVILEDFEKLIRESDEANRLFMDNPYYLCFQLCLVAAAMPARDANQKRSGDDRIQIRPIFDSHKEYSRVANTLFQKFKVKNPRSAEVLLPPGYDDDVDSSALQTADNLAYEVRKLLTRQISKGDDFMRKAMERLRPFTYRVYRLDYQALKLIVARQDPDYIPIPYMKVEELW
jgi:Protein of unknown function (DUF3800)